MNGSFHLLFLSVLLTQSLLTGSHVRHEEECPMNREAAASRGRQCLRKCKKNADCISSRKECLCDGLCGWSCVRPDLQCESLKPIVHGQPEATGNIFGSKVTYKCYGGYWMSGPRQRVCQGDGSWSGKTPACKKKPVCGPPPVVNHARYSAGLDKQEFEVDTIVNYTCFPGYQVVGLTRAKCMFYNTSAQWFGPDLQCTPRNCGDPGNVRNGDRSGNVFTFSRSVVYFCYRGFELDGPGTRYCNASGLWSGVLPTCKPVQCPVPAAPPNGKAIFTTLAYNSVVKYECHHGYRLSGSVTRRCKYNKEWEGEEPSCEEINCGELEDLHNGYLEGRTTTVGSVIVFHCFDGMKFQGKFISTTCLENGTWSNPLPQCLAYCVVPDVTNGRVNHFQPGTRVEDGQEIHVDCKQQHQFLYNTTPVTCRNGTWTHVPVCVPARCKYLPIKPRHGMVIAPKTDHGRTALFRCKDGYRLVGLNVTTCRFGQWTGSVPYCEEIYCPFPGYLKHGRVLLVGHMGMYDYRPYVRKVKNNRQILYECHKSYMLTDGPPGATCVDGAWSPGNIPRCVRGSHPRIRLIRSLKVSRHTELAEKKNEISEYFLNKPQSVRELEKTIRERRKGDLLQKKTNIRRTYEDSCPFLRPGPWMKIERLRPGKLNRTVPHRNKYHVTCTNGHHLNLQKPFIKCVRGRWKPKEPQCVASPCDLPEVVNGYYMTGYRTGQNVSHGSLVEFDCNHGYIKVITSLLCERGKFKPSSPVCLPSTTSIFPVVEKRKSFIHYRKNHNCTFWNNDPHLVAFYGDEQIKEEVTQFLPLSELVFRCQDIGKFRLIGSVRRSCVMGAWTGDKPSCYGLSQENNYALEDPPTILFRHHLGPIAQSNDGKLLVYPGAVLHLECLWIRKYGAPKWEVNHSYRKYPEGWTNEPGRDPHLEYRLSIYNAQKDDSGQFTCISPMGHRHSVNVVVDAVHCPTLNMTAGLVISTSSTVMTTKVVFKCHKGLSLIGNGQAICLPSGSWSSNPPSCEGDTCRPPPRMLDVITQTGIQNTYNTGDVIRFTCPAGLIMDGPTFLVCQSGHWTGSPPRCVPACTYPGRRPGAVISNVKFQYKVNETVTFKCTEGYRRVTIKCLDTGRWSASIPKCKKNGGTLKQHVLVDKRHSTNKLV